MGGGQCALGRYVAVGCVGMEGESRAGTGAWLGKRENPGAVGGAVWGTAGVERMGSGSRAPG